MLVTEVWKTLSKAPVIHALTLSDEKLKMDCLKFIVKWQGRNYRETMLKDAAGVCPVCADIFDADPWLLNCLNGTLDLRDGSFCVHDPDDMLSKLSGVRFDPEAESGRWEGFIAEVMQEDKDKAVFLQKAPGLCSERRYEA